MKNDPIKNVLRLSALLALMGTSCSKIEDKADNSPVNSLSGNQSEQFGYCSQILTQGIYDTNDFKNDFQAKSLLVSTACSTFKSYLDDNDNRWSKECDSSSGSSGGNLGIDAIVQAIPIGVDAGYSQGDSKSYCKDAGSRQSYRKVWYQNMCNGSLVDTNSSTATHQMLKSVNPEIVDAWKTCISQRHKGLTCFARKAGDGINFDINYDPDAFGADRVNLEFQFSGVSTDQTLPTTMGRGNVTKMFKFSDLTKESNVIVTASANGGGQISCDIQLPPQEPRVCENGNLVGLQSKAIYEKTASVCKVLDKCEANRLRAVFEGKYDWDMYNDLVYENRTVYFLGNGSFGTVHCTPELFKQRYSNEKL